MERQNGRRKNCKIPKYKLESLENKMIFMNNLY